MVDGETPTLRLRQDTTGGFRAQTWDIGGNEESFFVRDSSVANGIPFRVSVGAQEDSLRISPEGIGIGASRPAALLHIRSADGTGKLLVDVGGEAEPAPRLVATLQNNGAWAVEMVDTSWGKAFWAFQSQAGATSADATFKLTNSFGPGDEFVLQADGDLFITGTLTEGSDRNAKMAIVPVDPAEILEKVSALPVSAWTYRNDSSGARHLGPMAQDFHALFGLGESDTGISSLDSSGVALAAIKALDPRDADLAIENAKLAAQNKSLEAQNDRLEALVADLAARLHNVEVALE